MSYYSILTFPAFLLVILLTSACSQGKQKPPISEGKILAELYCQGCHDLPEPELLDKNTWKQYILPRMGYMLGMNRSDSVNKVLFEPGSIGQDVQEAGIFAKSPMLSEREWQVLQAYFIKKAPVQLAEPSLSHLIDSLPNFQVKIPQLRLHPPSTTLVQIHDLGGMYLGDAHTQSLLKLGPNMSILQAAKLKEGLVNLIQEKDYLYVTLLGSFSPTDAPSGMFMFLPLAEEKQTEVILPKLKRPVHTQLADLNGDQAKDIIISEFGKWTGELAWWKNQGAHGLEKHVLKSKAGATTSKIVDSNKDGKPDILALFAQGDEGIYLFENQGEDIFTEKKLLSFPASYGLSSLEVLDWNGDGELDLMISSGDNADYPSVVKPYHGIYLFLNTGEFEFIQSWFYALPGAYGVKVRDFDQDGDKDIAAISFFPDYEADPPRTFVYLENKGADSFNSYTFPGASQLGRWCVMDAGDVDQDGDIDIVLGSLAFEVPRNPALVTAWTEAGIPFLILENQFIP